MDLDIIRQLEKHEQFEVVGYATTLTVIKILNFIWLMKTLSSDNSKSSLEERFTVKLTSSQKKINRCYLLSD